MIKIIISLTYCYQSDIQLTNNVLINTGREILSYVLLIHVLGLFVFLLLLAYRFECVVTSVKKNPVNSLCFSG